MCGERRTLKKGGTCLVCLSVLFFKFIYIKNSSNFEVFDLTNLYRSHQICKISIQDYSNLVDFVIVIFGIFDFIMPLILENSNILQAASILKLLRILRAVRALRALRMLRTIK